MLSKKVFLHVDCKESHCSAAVAGAAIFPVYRQEE